MKKKCIIKNFSLHRKLIKIIYNDLLFNVYKASNFFTRNLARVLIIFVTTEEFPSKHFPKMLFKSIYNFPLNS